MTEAQMKLLIAITKKRKFVPSLLLNQKDRTLLWGYTTDRDSFHVYMKGGVVYRIIYSAQSQPYVERALEDPDLFVPNHRVYPDASDFEFCRLLLDLGVNHIPFLRYNSGREPTQYHGKIVEDFETLPKQSGIF